MKKTLLSLAVLAALHTTAQAGLVADRADLNTALGTSGVTEGFEDNWGSPYDTVYVSDSVLNASTNFSSSSGEYVSAGFLGSDVSFESYNFRIEGRYHQDNTVMQINHFVFIDFASVVNGVGFDISDFSWASGSTANVTIYGANDRDILHVASGISAPSLTGAPNFFGYSDATGIGAVRIESAYTGGSVGFLLDNLTYGATPVSAVPEPETYALFAAGLGLMGWARRRSDSSSRRARGE